MTNKYDKVTRWHCLSQGRQQFVTKLIVETMLVCWWYLSVCILFPFFLFGGIFFGEEQGYIVSKFAVINSNSAKTLVLTKSKYLRSGQKTRQEFSVCTVILNSFPCSPTAWCHNRVKKFSHRSVKLPNHGMLIITIICQLNTSQYVGRPGTAWWPIIP